MDAAGAQGHELEGRGCSAQGGRQEGNARLSVALSSVGFLYGSGAPLTLAAVFRAKLVEGGRTARSLLIPVSDPVPRLLGDWIGGDAAAVEEGMAALAREAGEAAAFGLLVSVDDIPRVRPARHGPPVLGLGPVGRSGVTISPTVRTNVGPWWNRGPSIRIVPIELSPTNPIVRWEPWIPEEALPVGASVTYDLRMWKLPRRAADEVPTYAVDHLEAPMHALTAATATGGIYEWKVRAVVHLPTKRFATSWSCAWITASDTSNGWKCVPFQLRAAPPTDRAAATPPSGWGEVPPNVGLPEQQGRGR